MPVTSIVDQNRVILEDNGKTVLVMTETINDHIVDVQLEGEMRNDIKHYLGDELKLLVLLNKDIVIDMKKVTYLSAACSEVLLNIQRAIDDTGGGSMRLKNIPAPILGGMKETGLSELIMIETAEG